MKKSDKTRTYSDDNKTAIYGDSEKLTKETVHNLKADDEIIFNNKEYSIIEIISESTGEAVIYRIEDKEQKAFALKLYYEFYNAENEPNTEALARIKAIDDADILNLIDFGTGINKYKGKYCFEISDFAHGLDLLDVKQLKEKYTLDFIEKEVIPQIFKGILKLHKNRIYHCDLKPQNVFYLDKEQIEIVIGDYGSAKTFEFDAEKKSRKTTTVKGTDFYLPPEQARGFISAKNDYYSFGMILLHLLYPEKILINENSLSRDDGKPKSLSRSKLKQIIERQFEAKPIIDYNPDYKRINNLIEGLTLVDFNLRWGKDQVQQWIEGKDIKVIYSKSNRLKTEAERIREKALIFGGYTISSPYDLRDYILHDKNWYADLIEDTQNRDDFIKWMLNIYDGDRSKRSALNRIIKFYSQEGIDFIAEAIIRFFIPEHPVIFGLKAFDFNDSIDLEKITAETFTYLISDLWDISSDKDIKLYLFRYEFALRQIEDKQQEVTNLLNILYKNLNITEEIRTDFGNYEVYTYTSVSKKSLKNIKQFLCEYMPAKHNIGFLKLNEQNELHYKLNRTLTGYYNKIGVNRLFEFNSEETISVYSPEENNSDKNYHKNPIDATIESICKRHLITVEMLSDNNLKLFKSNFANAVNKKLENLKKEYKKLRKELPRKIKRHDQVRDDLKEISLIITKKIYHKISSAFYLLEKTKKCGKELSALQKRKDEEEKPAKRRRRVTIMVTIFMILIGIYILVVIFFHDKI